MKGVGPGGPAGWKAGAVKGRAAGPAALPRGLRIRSSWAGAADGGTAPAGTLRWGPAGRLPRAGWPDHSSQSGHQVGPPDRIGPALLGQQVARPLLRAR